MLYSLLIHVATENINTSTTGPATVSFRRIAADLGFEHELMAGVFLQSAQHSTSVRNREGLTRVLPGPLEDRPLKLAGFALIECESRGRAVEVTQSVQYALGDAAAAVELRLVLKQGCVEVIEERAKKIEMDVESASVQPSTP